ncbi:MAG: hypothetical protein F4194_00135 [Acidimicrobiia bacterium]|nr:hypothetical protein [Acidimicrobiia bacterium]
MSREEIRDSAGQAAGMLDDFPEIADNELRTKNSLIEPFLRSLGYDTTHPEQVTLEELTDLGGKIDYVLRGETRATIAVEAKRAGLKLSDKETKQLRSYFTFSAAVAGILTNGVDYWLFTDLHKPNVMDSEPYRQIDITQLGDNDIHHFETLTRENVQQSAVREQAQRERYRTLVDEIVAEELRNPSLEFLKLVGKRAGIKPLTRANLEFLSPLVAEAVAGHLNKEAPTYPPSDAPSDESPPTPSPVESPLSPGKKGSITRRQLQGATLFGQARSVHSYREVLTSVVAELQTLHGKGGFAARVLDQRVFRGRKWWYISTEQHHLGPDRTKSKVGDHWVDTNLNAKNMVRRARLFLTAFGHDPDELVIHTSDE